MLEGVVMWKELKGKPADSWTFMAHNWIPLVCIGTCALSRNFYWWGTTKTKSIRILQSNSSSFNGHKVLFVCFRVCGHIFLFFSFRRKKWSHTSASSLKEQLNPFNQGQGIAGSVSCRISFRRLRFKCNSNFILVFHLFYFYASIG